jgi:competence protein ComEA
MKVQVTIQIVKETTPMLNLRHKFLAAALLIAAVPAFAAPLSAIAQAAKPSTVTSIPLDINTASSEQIKALPGIGDAYAKRIVDGRPYTAKNQLLNRGILPQKTYDGIKDMIIATHAPKK